MFLDKQSDIRESPLSKALLGIIQDTTIASTVNLLEKNISGLPLLGETPEDFQRFFLLGESILGLGEQNLKGDQLQAYKLLQEQPNTIVSIFENSDTHIWMCYWDWDKDIQPQDTFMRPIKQSLPSIMSTWKVRAHHTQVQNILRELIRNTLDHGNGKAIFMIYQDVKGYLFTYREGGVGIFESEYVQGFIKQGMGQEEVVKRLFCSGISSKSDSFKNWGMGSTILFNTGNNFGLTLFDGGKKVHQGEKPGTLSITNTDQKCSGLLYCKYEQI